MTGKLARDSGQAWRCVAALGWSSAALATPVAAGAAEPPPPTYSLSWVRGEGAEACPPARALASEVERRLGRKVFDPASERAFEVQVTRSAEHYQSDVFVRDERGGTLGHRSLESDEPDCAAVFNATALAIALVIDPEAASRQPDASKAVAAFDTPAPAVAAPASPPPAPPPAPAPELPPAAPAERHVPTSIALRTELSSGLVPGVSTGLALAFTARPDERFGFAASASYTAPRTAREGGGVYDIALTRVGLALTFDPARSRRFRLALSGGLSVGAFHLGVIEPAPVLEPGNFLFLALELGADLQVSITEGFFIELGGLAQLNPLRQAFFVAGEPEPVWQQPVLCGAGFLGLGVAFP
ncbi:MAG TPA: hypothetical protein VIW29_01660 [Polyangiaceae bacterium]